MFIAAINVPFAMVGSSRRKIATTLATRQRYASSARGETALGARR